MFIEKFKDLIIPRYIYELLYIHTEAFGTVAHKSSESYCVEHITPSGFKGSIEQKRYFLTVKTEDNEYIEIVSPEFFRTIAIGQNVKIIRSKLFYQKSFHTRFEKN